MAELTESFKRFEADQQEGSQSMCSLLQSYVMPLLIELDRHLDKRFVRTFLQCLVAIIRLRNSPQALWLSELGSALEGYEGQSQRAPAGTKRVSKLLQSAKWSVQDLEAYWLAQADQEVQKLIALGKRVLCLWDGSVVEKTESQKSEGLSPVLSSKAKRKQRSIFGVLFNWPVTRPIRVMGMQWSAGMIAGLEGLPHLAVSRWWSRKGPHAATLRETEEALLGMCVRKWGPLLIHVFDRGYASTAWLAVLLKYRARFIIRWIGKHVFLTLAGEEKKLWQIGQNKKYLAHREVRDTRSGLLSPCSLWWTQVYHPSSQAPLFLVKVRINKGPMYLITNEPVTNEEQAWEVFLSYCKRWQIELAFRYAKCELALESPRLWSMQARLKLFGMLMLVYGFLLSLLDPKYQPLCEALLRLKCHRTGKRSQQTQAPLYRVRWALSRLWNDYRPRLSCFLPPSDDPFATLSLIRGVERIAKNRG